MVDAKLLSIIRTALTTMFNWAFCNCLLSFLILIPICSYAKISTQCGIEKFKKYQIEYCLYEGQGPLLVFEAPLGNGIKNWPKTFLKKLNQFSTILVYNRIGVGRSFFYNKKIQAPVTAKFVSEHLHNLLKRLDLNKPIILIAHSIGGIYAQYFIRNYPESIAALVLIDSSSSFEPKKNSPFQSKTPERKGSTEYFESIGFNQSMDHVNSSPSFPNIPLLIITATNHGSSTLIETQWEKLQKTMAKQSPQGKQIIAYGSGHFIYQDKPDLVINEIHNLIQKNRIR